jgi:xylulokinase
MIPRRSGRNILAVDIGTSSLKGGVFNFDGDLLYNHRSLLHGARDSFNAHEWSSSLISFLDRLEESSPFTRSMIEGVVISGHGPTLVPLGQDGQPSAPVLMWCDGHSEKQDTPSFYLPRALWFKNNRPGLYKKTHHFLGSAEYLLYCLTGQKLMITAGPSFNPHLWTNELLDNLGLDKNMFPPLTQLGESSPACVDEKGAALTGLTRGIPVYSGGSDFFTALLGAGAVEPGILCDRAGTSEGLNIISRKSENHDHIRFLPHPVGEGICNGSVILSSTGALFEWYRRLTGQEDWSYEKTMEGILSSRSSGCPDFFPSLKDGGLWEFSGGMLIGLEPDMDRFQLGRAVLEAIGYALKKGLEILENETGPIRKFVTVGGQAKSQLWNQMKADMLGCPVEVPRVADAELLGGVMVFLTGQGIYSSLMEASKKLYSTREIVKPGEREYYDKKFIRYGELATEIRAFFMGNKKRLERL